MEQTASSPQPTEPPPPLPLPQSQPQQPSSSLPPPSPSGLPSLNPNLNPNPNPSQNPNPNPTPKTLTPVQQQSQFSQPRPPFNRPWQPQSSPFSHFGSLPSPSSSSPAAASSSSTSPSPSVSLPPPPRSGIAIGVPAHHPSPAPPQSTPFSSLNSPSFGQQFGGLGRSSVNVPDSVASSSSSQVRQPIQGYQSMGTMGSMGSGSQMRPGGGPTHQQLRPVQPSLRPQSTPNNQSSATQNFQGQSLLRVSSVGSPSPSSPAPNSPQGMQSHNQPWLSSGSHGKPPLPTSGYRPQLTPQSLQQRSHIPQQHHHSLPTASQQQQTSSSQQSQQPLPSHQQQEPYGQHFPPSRVPALPHQPQIRVQGVGNQKPSSLATVQPSAIQSGPQAKTASPEIGETCNRILSKRSIQELVSQIDSTEKLDPDVEDILVDIADDFVESITTFGCSLAKLRKSSTLEAKDILLHLERNWNLSLPGFSGDEIKNYRKPITNDIHKERLAAIKKSVAGTETANTKSSAGQAAGNAKGHLAKAPASAMDS